MSAVITLIKFLFQQLLKLCVWHVCVLLNLLCAIPSCNLESLPYINYYCIAQ